MTHEDNVAAIRQQDFEHEQQCREIEYVRAQFIRAAKLGDMNAVADWAPTTFMGQKMEITVGEALFAAMDMGDGPTTNDVLALFCRSAFGNHNEFSSYQLLQRLADQFVRHYA